MRGISWCGWADGAYPIREPLVWVFIFFYITSGVLNWIKIVKSFLSCSEKILKYVSLKIFEKEIFFSQCTPLQQFCENTKFQEGFASSKVFIWRIR